MPSLEDLTHGELLNVARQGSEAAELLNTLMGSPETRETMLRLSKKLNPKLSIPEIDAKDAVIEQLNAEKAARESLEQKILEQEIRQKVNDNRSRLKTQYGFNDDDILEVEKIMTDKDAPIPSYDGAAKYLQASRQVAAPTPSTIEPAVMNMPDQQIWGKGIGNRGMLDKIATQEAFAALQQFRSGKTG